MLKVLDEICKPTKGSKDSAAIDLYARDDIIIGAGETVKVPLGVCIDINIDWYMGNKINKNPTYGQGAIDAFEDFIKSHYLQLEPRSSLRVKGIIAGTGIIDLDCKDEIVIILNKPTKARSERTESLVNGQVRYTKDFYVEGDNYKISKGDKIAQILLKEHKTWILGIENNNERIGGLGSTGK